MLSFKVILEVLALPLFSLTIMYNVLNPEVPFAPDRVIQFSSQVADHGKSLSI